MPFIPDALRGPVFMILSTAFYVVNDTMMKLATHGLPPYEVLFLRGVAAAIWGLPLLCLLGYGRKAPLMFERRVLLRNVMELAGVVAYVVALTNMPIAVAIALGQVAPLLLLLGASIFLGERIGSVRMGLIGIGFLGALMVAQPSADGISVYALLGLANAVFSAVRDLVGRRVAADTPGMVVAISAVLVVLAGAGIAHFTAETWVMPGPHHLALLAGAGFFLIFGHFFIFMAYRVGRAGVVAPFYYGFSVWAVFSGLLVFGELPNLPAIIGICLIILAGLIIVLLDERRRRLTIVA
jgi:drug/metabolite transporter (DMT)-like permease